MVDSSSGVASLPTLDLPDPDEDYPDLTVEDSSDPTKFVKPDLSERFPSSPGGAVFAYSSTFSILFLVWGAVIG